jgi:hypothetical protein
MRNLKLYEDYNSPPEYEDGPDPEEIGRDIEHTEAEQLFTPLFVTEETPSSDGPRRSGNGRIDFDLLMDKTPEKTLWAVHVIDDAIPDSYKMLWNTADGEQHIQDEEAVINFATDEFRGDRYSKGVEAWEEDINNYAIKDNICLLKLATPADVDFMLEDLYDYLRPGHGSYVAKQRGYSSNALRPEEISRVKRAINALVKYKRRIESNTVGGPNKV